MMTLILVASVILVLFIGLLRYDIHQQKYRDPPKHNESDQDNDGPHDKA